MSGKPVTQSELIYVIRNAYNERYEQSTKDSVYSQYDNSGKHCATNAWKYSRAWCNLRALKDKIDGQVK